MLNFRFSGALTCARVQRCGSDVRVGAFGAARGGGRRRRARKSVLQRQNCRRLPRGQWTRIISRRERQFSEFGFFNSIANVNSDSDRSFNIFNIHNVSNLHNQPANTVHYRIEQLISDWLKQNCKRIACRKYQLGQIDCIRVSKAYLKMLRAIGNNESPNKYQGKYSLSLRHLYHLNN